MPNEPNKQLSVAIEAQHKTLSLGIQRNEGSTEFNITPIPVRTTRHAETAERLATPRKIAVAGDVIGDSYFDGSEDVVIGTAVECLSTIEIDDLIASAMSIGG